MKEQNHILRIATTRSAEGISRLLDRINFFVSVYQYLEFDQHEEFLCILMENVNTFKDDMSSLLSYLDKIIDKLRMPIDVKNGEKDEIL